MDNSLSPASSLSTVQSYGNTYYNSGQKASTAETADDLWHLNALVNPGDTPTKNLPFTPSQAAVVSPQTVYATPNTHRVDFGSDLKEHFYTPLGTLETVFSNPSTSFKFGTADKGPAARLFSPPQELSHTGRPPVHAYDHDADSLLSLQSGDTHLGGPSVSTGWQDREQPSMDMQPHDTSDLASKPTYASFISDLTDPQHDLASPAFQYCSVAAKAGLGSPGASSQLGAEPIKWNTGIEYEQELSGELQGQPAAVERAFGSTFAIAAGDELAAVRRAAPVSTGPSNSIPATVSEYTYEDEQEEQEEEEELAGSQHESFDDEESWGQPVCGPESIPSDRGDEAGSESEGALTGELSQETHQQQHHQHMHYDDDEQQQQQEEEEGMRCGYGTGTELNSMQSQGQGEPGSWSGQGDEDMYLAYTHSATAGADEEQEDDTQWGPPPCSDDGDGDGDGGASYTAGEPGIDALIDQLNLKPASLGAGSGGDHMAYRQSSQALSDLSDVSDLMGMDSQTAADAEAFAQYMCPSPPSRVSAHEMAAYGFSNPLAAGAAAGASPAAVGQAGFSPSRADVSPVTSDPRADPRAGSTPYMLQRRYIPVGTPASGDSPGFMSPSAAFQRHAELDAPVRARGEVEGAGRQTWAQSDERVAHEHAQLPTFQQQQGRQQQGYADLQHQHQLAVSPNQARAASAHQPVVSPGKAHGAVVVGRHGLLKQADFDQLSPDRYSRPAMDEVHVDEEDPGSFSDLSAPSSPAAARGSASGGFLHDNLLAAAAAPAPALQHNQPLQAPTSFAAQANSRWSGAPAVQPQQHVRKPGLVVPPLDLNIMRHTASPRTTASPHTITPPYPQLTYASQPPSNPHNHPTLSPHLLTSPRVTHSPRPSAIPRSPRPADPPAYSSSLSRFSRTTRSPSPRLNEVLAEALQVYPVLGSPRPSGIPLSPRPEPTPTTASIPGSPAARGSTGRLSPAAAAPDLYSMDGTSADQYAGSDVSSHSADPYIARPGSAHQECVLHSITAELPTRPAAALPQRINTLSRMSAAAPAAAAPAAVAPGSSVVSVHQVVAAPHRSRAAAAPAPAPAAAPTTRKSSMQSSAAAARPSAAVTAAAVRQTSAAAAAARAIPGATASMSRTLGRNAATTTASATTTTLAAKAAAVNPVVKPGVVVGGAARGVVPGVTRPGSAGGADAPARSQVSTTTTTTQAVAAAAIASSKSRTGAAPGPTALVPPSRPGLSTKPAVPSATSRSIPTRPTTTTTINTSVTSHPSKLKAPSTSTRPHMPSEPKVSHIVAGLAAPVSRSSSTTTSSSRAAPAARVQPDSLPPTRKAANPTPSAPTRKAPIPTISRAPARGSPHATTQPLPKPLTPPVAVSTTPNPAHPVSAAHRYGRPEATDDHHAAPASQGSACAGEGHLPVDTSNGSSQRPSWGSELSASTLTDSVPASLPASASSAQPPADVAQPASVIKETNIGSPSIFARAQLKPPSEGKGTPTVLLKSKPRTPGQPASARASAAGTNTATKPVSLKPVSPLPIQALTPAAVQGVAGSSPAAAVTPVIVEPVSADDSQQRQQLPASCSPSPPATGAAGPGNVSKPSKAVDWSRLWTLTPTSSFQVGVPSPTLASPTFQPPLLASSNHTPVACLGAPSSPDAAPARTVRGPAPIDPFVPMTEFKLPGPARHVLETASPPDLMSPLPGSPAGDFGKWQRDVGSSTMMMMTPVPSMYGPRQPLHVYEAGAQVLEQEQEELGGLAPPRCTSPERQAMGRRSAAKQGSRAGASKQGPTQLTPPPPIDDSFIRMSLFEVP